MSCHITLRNRSTVGKFFVELSVEGFGFSTRKFKALIDTGASGISVPHNDMQEILDIFTGENDKQLLKKVKRIKTYGAYGNKPALADVYKLPKVKIEDLYFKDIVIHSSVSRVKTHWLIGQSILRNCCYSIDNIANIMTLDFSRKVVDKANFYSKDVKLKSYSEVGIGGIDNSSEYFVVAEESRILKFMQMTGEIVHYDMELDQYAVHPGIEITLEKLQSLKKKGFILKENDCYKFLGREE